MDRKQIARDISAHHLGLLLPVVASTVRESISEWSTEEPKDTDVAMMIDFVMARVAAAMSQAVEEAIEVDRAR